MRTESILSIAKNLTLNEYLTGSSLFRAIDKFCNVVEVWNLLNWKLGL
ncbi:hypothetical protein AC094_00020 [Bacteroides fragilis]|uniref:Uncharacterized protein n=1 Tax=Bacteroides fragilis TaxID=817 RepID=A0A853Q652_BACFG|nr:hypothetical protein M075_4645 [Bacteroides fragilis str. 20793-3]OCR36846.1 hypothetical protein AC094_00020 [Bacteroides fragilis]